MYYKIYLVQIRVDIFDPGNFEFKYFFPFFFFVVLVCISQCLVDTVCICVAQSLFVDTTMVSEFELNCLCLSVNFD